jgi:hypothetical protein
VGNSQRKKRGTFRFDKEFVNLWATRYVQEALAGNALEGELLSELGPRVAKRGFLEKAELARIGDWKTTRVRTQLASNSEADVTDITRLALAAPERLQHRILCLLVGVGHPMASAILTVCDSTRYTVLDFRAVEALRYLQQIGALRAEVPDGNRGGLPGYYAYLQFCRKVARELDVSLRALDRCLWQWSKDGMPLE